MILSEDIFCVSLALLSFLQLKLVMKVMSLAREGSKLIPVEVELILIPGLPQIHFLGLPDQVIRESIHRIKSAIRHQGFEFPKTKQILVNIRPQHIKKKFSRS